MASTVDEISIRYEEDGQELVRELQKEVLSRGSWATIMFFQFSYAASAPNIRFMGLVFRPRANGLKPFL